jgi:hydroxypyruvate isomerase
MSGIKLAYNVNGLRNLPLETAVAEIADAGFDAVELSLHPSHIDPATFDERDAERLRKVLTKCGISACTLATGADDLLSSERFEPSLIHPTSEGRKSRIDLLLQAITIARWLGLPSINFASGLRKPEVDPEQAQRWLREGVLRLVEAAAGEIGLAMEPEPGFHVQTNDQVAALRAETGGQALTLCQDIGHCRSVEDDFLESIERNLSITTHIQIEDIKGRRHYHLIPGDGDIDFPTVIGLVQRGGYQGCLSVELYNDANRHHEALLRSHSVLRAAADQAMADS